MNSDWGEDEMGSWSMCAIVRESIPEIQIIKDLVSVFFGSVAVMSFAF